MSANNVFHSLTSDVYKQDLFVNLGVAENPELLELDDGRIDSRFGGVLNVDGNPTIGFGFDFVSTGFSAAKIQELVNKHIPTRSASRKISDAQCKLLAAYLSKSKYVEEGHALNGKTISTPEILRQLSNVVLTKSEAKLLFDDMVQLCESS